MNVIKPHRFFVIKSINAPVYYTNDNETIWIRAELLQGLVGIFIATYEENWHYYDLKEYDRIRSLLDFL